MKLAVAVSIVDKQSNEPHTVQIQIIESDSLELDFDAVKELLAANDNFAQTLEDEEELAAAFEACNDPDVLEKELKNFQIDVQFDAVVISN